MPSTAAWYRLALAASLGATPVDAQVTVAVSADAASQHVARGLTLTNRPVLQPTGSMQWTRGSLGLGLEAMGSVEAGRYDDPLHHISENGGVGVDLAEYTIAATATRTWGALALSAGWAVYRFPNEFGATAECNSSEWMVGMSLAGPLAVAVTTWNDVEKIRGAYSEVEVTGEARRVAAGALVGWNFGQSIGDGGVAGAYHASGPTHLELFASIRQQSGRVMLEPKVHVVIPRDELTRIQSPSVQGGLKLWFGVSVSWERGTGGDLPDGSP